MSTYHRQLSVDSFRVSLADDPWKQVTDKYRSVFRLQGFDILIVLVPRSAIALFRFRSQRHIVVNRIEAS